MKVYEYRCTRNEPYQGNCLGANDLSARQGHYINATSPERARQIMAKRFPKDTLGFTADKIGEAHFQTEDSE